MSTIAPNFLIQSKNYGVFYEEKSLYSG